MVSGPCVLVWLNTDTDCRHVHTRTPSKSLSHLLTRMELLVLPKCPGKKVVMHANRPRISQFTRRHDGGAEGADWSLEVVLETISVKANRDMADFREQGFRVAGVFVFSLPFFCSCSED